jgi:hypothetical protein
MGKGIVKLGEGNWAVKDGNLLAAKETNGRFKNAEFTVTRGTRATYVGRDGLIKESNLQDTNLVPSIVTTENNNGGVINYISSNIYSSTSDGTSTSIIRPKFNFNTTNGNTYKLVITPTGTITGTVNFDFYDGSSYLFQDYDFTTTKEIYFTHNGNVFGAFDGQQTYSIASFTISIQEVKINTPRIDFTDNTDGHLLLEPQSTNLITYSEDFSEWTFLGNTNINATNITSPSGENNATNITGLNGSGTNDLRKQLTYNTANKTLTFSVYLKGSGTLRLQMSNGIDQAFQNVITLTNQWQRYNVSGTFNSTSVSIFYLVIDDHSGLTATSYDVWGAQVEELSYATSYIPTNGSQVTRDAETCTGAGETADFNNSEGVFYAEIAALVNDQTYRSMSLGDGNNADCVRLRFRNQTNSINGLVRDSSTAKGNISYEVSDIKQFHKVAYKYKSGDCQLWIDGVQRATSTDTFTPSPLTQLNFNQGTSSDIFYGKCKAIRVYKETDGIDLATLTS